MATSTSANFRDDQPLNDDLIHLNSVPDESVVNLPPVPNYKTPSLISILEDAVDQLAVLDDIVPDTERTDNQGRALASEINRIVKERSDLQQRYQNVVKEQPILKNLSNKSKFKENQHVISNISNEYAHSTNALARALRSHPSVAQNLKKIQNERGSIQTLIFKTIRELKDGKYESLRKIVDEEYQRRDALHNTIQKEKKAFEKLKQLQHDLVHEKHVFEEEINERNHVIQQLKDTIQEINILTLSEQKYIKKEMKARESSVKQRCGLKEGQLVEARNEISKKIELEVKCHERIVQFLAKQRDEMEKQIQEWMTKYEDDTEKKTNELESLKSQRAQDLEKFENLVNQYEEYEKFVEEYKLSKKREEETRILIERQTKACLVLQKFWRRYVERLRESQKSKKGKGKKGKKGK